MCTQKIELTGKKVTVIGGGVIGSSWAALFLANGMLVTVSDPSDNIESRVKEYIQNAFTDLKELNSNLEKLENNYLENNLFFEKDTAKAVSNTDYIQENIPERLELKIALWKAIEENAPATALFFSSSSSIPATIQGQELKQPERLIVGHPFNPPHLMPLVEVVPGEKQKKEYVQHALDFYNSLGKSAQLIKKEVPGFVANRLQSAIFRECVYLVAEGVVDITQLDNVITSSLGIRWASGGPYLQFHLGGGEQGMKHFFEQFSPSMEAVWKIQAANKVTFDEQTKNLILQQVSETYAQSSIESLESERNKKQLAIMKALDEL